MKRSRRRRERNRDRYRAVLHRRELGRRKLNCAARPYVQSALVFDDENGGHSALQHGAAQADGDRGDNSQLSGSESCPSEAAKADGDGRAEVDVPLHVFITTAYAENSTLGAFLRAWRSQSSRVPTRSGKCKPRGGSARRGLFPCASPVFNDGRRRRNLPASASEAHLSTSFVVC